MSNVKTIPYPLSRGEPLKTFPINKSGTIFFLCNTWKYKFQKCMT
jgi:hypothetical protein